MTTTLSSPTPALEPIAAEEHVDCDLCGGRDADTVLPGRWPLLRCRTCALVYTSPRPTPEHFREVYDGSYYTNKPAVAGNPQATRRRIRDLVLRCFWGYPGDLGTLEKVVCRLLLRPLRSRVMPLPFAPQAVVLDVGCGNGAQLAELHRYGYTRLHGVEPSPLAAAHARQASGASIHEGTLESVNLPAGHFDLVILNQALEHVPSPSATLRQVRRVMKPGGSLYLTVPNFGSLESRLFGKDWEALSLPHHFHHFTRATLLHLLRESGFDVRLLRTDSDASVTCASLSAWVTGRAPWLRRLHRAAPWITLPLALAADMSGVGSCLRVVARATAEPSAA